MRRKCQNLPLQLGRVYSIGYGVGYPGIGYGVGYQTIGYGVGYPGAVPRHTPGGTPPGPATRPILGKILENFGCQSAQNF